MGNITSTLGELPQTATDALKKETKAVANEILNEIGISKPAETQKQTTQTSDTKDFMRQIYAPKNPLDETRLAQSQENEEAYRKQRLALLRGENIETLENPAVKKRMESEHRYNASMLGVTQENPETEKQKREEEDGQELKAPHDRTSEAGLADSEPILPGNRGRKGMKTKMQTRILNRSKAKAELGKNQGQG